MMGTAPRLRTRQSSGLRKGPSKAARDVDSHRSTHLSLGCSAKPPSLATNTLPGLDTTSPTTQQDLENALEDIAPEIVVWTEDMDAMVVDSPEPAMSATPAQGESSMYVL